MPRTAHRVKNTHPILGVKKSKTKSGTLSSSKKSKKNKSSTKKTIIPAETKTPRVRVAVKIDKSEFLEGITNPAIIRLARRAGVKRISKKVHKPISDYATEYLNTLIRNSFIYCDSGKRKTIASRDVKNALSLMGQKFYGAGVK